MVSIVPGKFLQKTGVGDAYASGFLANFLYNKSDFQENLLSGAMNAASVIEHLGSQPGLLTREVLMQKIDMYKNKDGKK